MASLLAMGQLWARGVTRRVKRSGNEALHTKPHTYIGLVLWSGRTPLVDPEVKGRGPGENS
jgi:hypothetical protein